MESKDLAKLNITYKSKWENEFGNVSNDGLEDMWSDIFTTLAEVQRRNTLRRRGITDAPNIEPLNIVYSSTMGTGKSTTVQHYLLNGLDTTFYKALIVVELIETCNEYELLLKDKGAVAVHSENSNSLEDNLEAPILIITHNRLAGLLNRGISDDVFNSYDLVVIDEQVKTYQHISFTWKDLMRDLYTPLVSAGSFDGLVKVMFTHLTETMEKYREDRTNRIDVINKYSDGRDDILDWASLAEELYTKANDKSLQLNNLERKKLNTFANECRALSKQGRMKVAFYQSKAGVISFNVVIDFLPIHISKVLFDGTASINDTYTLLNEHIGNDTVEIKPYHKLRSFKNANVKYYSMATGKGSLTVDVDAMSKSEYDKKIIEVKSNLESLVKNTIERYGKDERVLFIIHKLNIEYIEPLLLDTNYTFTWWGKHIGSNEWKEYRKVVVYGLNYLPENVYTAMYFSTLSANVVADTSPIDDFKSGLLTVDILQAIFRGSLRTVIDDEGNCDSDCEVIISLPKNEKVKNNILSRMKCILWDATYTEITDGAQPIKLNSRNIQKIKKLLSKLEKSENSYIDKKVPNRKTHYSFLSESIGYSRKDLLDLLIRGAHSEANNKLLLDNNWLYTKATPEDRATLGIKGKSPYVFKYIGTFSDEAPSLDVNGQEF